MLQFWNLFNAKSFLTGKSAFHQLGESKEFLFIVMLIFIGQVLIVQFGGAMFNVEALSLRDWLLITVNTSVVFLFGELYRILRKRKEAAVLHRLMSNQRKSTKIKPNNKIHE